MNLGKMRLENKVQEQKGRFFSVTFTKKDGTNRKLTGRCGVRKYLAGGANKVVKESNSYMTVWDKDAKSYRTVNLATVTKLVCGGVTYDVV